MCSSIAQFMWCLQYRLLVADSSTIVGWRVHNVMVPACMQPCLDVFILPYFLFYMLSGRLISLMYRQQTCFMQPLSVPECVVSGCCCTEAHVTSGARDQFASCSGAAPSYVAL
jgi:hypothetical protein